MEDEPTRRSGRVAAKATETATEPPPPHREQGSRRSSRTKPAPPPRAPPPPPATKKVAKKKSKKTKKQRVNPKRKSLPTFLHDEEENQVWIAPLLANEIQRAEKTGKHPMNQKRLYLHTVASPAYRQAVYLRTARAWQDLEETLLPTYGGRKWKVQVTIKDPVNSKGHAVSPFFCFQGGSLEIAVWPHWLASIPEPPRFPGYTKGSTKSGPEPSEEEEVEEEEEETEEDEEMEVLEEMQSREMSSLSKLANAERWRVPVPTCSIKWRSPLHESFSSRKSAWEHAKKLCQNEVFLDKVLSGYHANGQPITKITTPGVKTVLKAGHMRFLRDGLWVIGQEEEWQQERLKEIGVSGGAVVTATTTPRKMSTLAYYIQENRKEHQKKRSNEMSQNGEKAKFTLREAETELRAVWKTLTKEEQENWAARARCFRDGAKPENGSSSESKGYASPATIPDVHSETDSHVAPAMAASPHENSAAQLSGESDDTSIVDRKVESSDNVARSETTDAKAEAVATQQEKVQERSSAGEVAQPETGKLIAGRVTPSSESEAPSQRMPLKCSGAVLSVEFPPPRDQNKTSTNGKGPQTQDSLAVRATAQVSTKPSPSITWCLQQEQIDLCYQASLDHYDSVISTVQARDLTREFQDGFDVLRERGKGRFDMELPAFDQPEFNFLTNLKKTPWMPVVRQILGKEVVLIHKGVFISMPGAEAQNYHQDGVHLTTQYQKPCHAINVFVPLVDLKMKSGPTEFCLGSHILGREDYDEAFLETPLVEAGTPVIFDYRLGHKGLANTSDTCRPILYCTYAAAADGKEFRDLVNFSRKRYHKIGDMVSKTPSREERAQKRQRVLY